MNTTTVGSQLYADTNFSRAEDLKLIQGLGHFTADQSYPGELHLFVIRSQYPHARITRMDLSQVESAPGVKWVMTAKDIEAHGGKDLPSAPPVMTTSGKPQELNKMPVLAREWVRFVGQPIAFVVAQTYHQAQDAAELAQIEFEEHAACKNADAAKLPGATQLHASAPGNVSGDFQSGDLAAVQAQFARAHHVSHLTIRSQRLFGVPMEPRAVVAFHDPATQRTRLHTPSQGLLSMQAYLAQCSGVPESEVDIVTNDVGGSFGLRTGAYSEHVGVVIASRVLGQAVKWVGTRSEVFLSDWHARALTLNGSMALDAEGHILAIRFEDRVDVGAYNCYMSSFIGSRNLSVTMGGVYRVPALYMHSEMVYSNTTPTSAYRGAGRPDIAYSIERLMDFACHEHGLDPIATRRKNFIPVSDFPYKTANGTSYDLCDFDQVMTKALKLADHEHYAERKAAASRAGKLRGLGVSTYVEASGAGTAQMDQVSGQMGADGVLTIEGVTGPSGQGHQTSFAKIVHTELGMLEKDIRYGSAKTGTALQGNGTGGSRSLYGAGSAIKNMCVQLKAQLTVLLAAHWACQPDAVKFQNDAWVGEGAAFSKPLSTTEALALLTPSERAGLQATGEAKSGSTFPNGCHVVEIEIDPETGETAIANYTAVDELGRVISPHLVRGQVHGGVVQGLGQAFMEQVIYDDQGQLITGSFMDYAMPRAGDLKALNNATVELGTELNLLGAKGVGESGCTGSLPALANAMMDALRPFGVDRMDMPFTPEKVWSALHSKA